MRNLSYENEFCMQFHFHANQSHFHNNGFALRLALKQRHKGTRKWPVTVHAPFLVLAIARNQKSLSNMAINCVGRKFKNNFQTALKESLALFPVDEFKAEERLIIKKMVARRDVFGQLPTATVKV